MLIVIVSTLLSVGMWSIAISRSVCMFLCVSVSWKHCTIHVYYGCGFVLLW